MLLGIDPGVNNCGLTVVDTTAGFSVITTHSVKNARKFTDAEKELEQEFNTRVVKVSAIINKVNEVLDAYPLIDYVAIEAPFYNRLTPQAFGSLLEVIAAIKYNILVPRKMKFRMLEPMLVKKIFAEKGMAKKEVMKQFLISKKAAGTILMDIDIETLSEHEIDAIAIVYSHYVTNAQEGLLS